MQSHCSKCNKSFTERVGMSPMEGNLAIRMRNKLGNICPECQVNIAKTKKGRRQLFFWKFKVAFYCLRFLIPILLFFVFLTFILAFFVL